MISAFIFMIVSSTNTTDHPYTGWLKKVSCCTVSTAYFFWATL